MNLSLRLGSVLIVLAGSAVYGGGTSFAVRVIAFDRQDQDNATFRLEAVDAKDPVVPGCLSLTVVASYGPPDLAHVIGVAEPPSTREAHRKALDMLATAYRDKTETRFGLISDGLSKEPGGATCEFRSRAMKPAEEYGGRIVPYSYARWPRWP